MVEDLVFAAAPDEPGIALDPAGAVKDVEAPTLALGVAAVDRGEAVLRVHAPELVRDQVGSAASPGTSLKVTWGWRPRSKLRECTMRSATVSVGDFVPRSYAESVGPGSSLGSTSSLLSALNTRWIVEITTLEEPSLPALVSLSTL